jgi:hypothetical protein
MSLFLLVPALLAQSPTPLPVVAAKDLPKAARGPLPPEGPDPGAEGGIQGANRRAARRGPSVPALQLPPGSVRVKDQVPDISGWRCYAIEVPPGEKVRVQVVEGRKAWFKVKGVNQWGRLEEGLLQNRIHRGEPMATYQNPTQEKKTIYFLVDTLDASMVGEAFEVEVQRN